MLRVLHVDDEEDQLIIGKRFLEKADQSLKIVYTTSPEEALSMLGEQPFDCVVSDYQMPEMNGFEFAERMKKAFRIPFIIYTGRGSEEVAEKAFSVGIDDYVRKEFDKSHYQVLAKRIRMAVDKHRAEEELRRERDRAFRYLTVARVMIVALNEEGKITLLNQRGCEVLGCSEEEALGKNWFDSFVPDRMRGEAKQVFKSLMRGEIEPFEYYENQVLTKNGEEQLIAWYNVVIKDPEGRITGTLSSGTDVTEQKQMEEELKRSEERWRSLVEMVPDGIIIMDMNGVFTSVNSATLKLSGCSKEDFLGKHFSEAPILNERDLPRLQNMFNSFLKGETVKPFEIVFTRKEGSTVWAEFHTCFIEVDGNKIGIQIIMKDITERKQAEAYAK